MVCSHFQDLGVAMRVSENTFIDWPFLGKFYDSEPLPKFELRNPYIGEHNDKCGFSLENSMVLNHYPNLGFATPVWEITMNNLAFHLKTQCFGANTKICVL